MRCPETLRLQDCIEAAGAPIHVCVNVYCCVMLPVWQLRQHLWTSITLVQSFAVIADKPHIICLEQT